MKKFENKIILVTGGGRGMGAAIVQKFVAEGAFVFINYLDNEDEVGALRNKLGHENCEGVQADVSSEEAVSAMFEKVRDIKGSLDVLVNNAGIVDNTEFLATPLTKWNKIFAVNVNGPFLCMQKAVPMMNEGGSIVNIASIRGLYNYGRPSSVDYCASKAALISMTKSIAKDLAPKIRVNSVSPGVTQTPLLDDYDEEYLNGLRENMYMGDLIQPQEVADAVIFLASNHARSITGENLMVDGGQSLRTV